MARHLRLLITALVAVCALVLSGCGSDEPASTPAAGGKQRIAAIFSGPTTDADYNALGLLALKDAEAKGAEIAFSESVAVPDIERVLNEYVAGNYTVIWTHGSQFHEATTKVAQANPNVQFISEFDGKPENQPANQWVLDRNFHLGFYAVGVLASKLSKTGTVGYVGGLSLPFSYSEVHAMEQAIADTGASTKLNPVWTGDFNDPAKSQQISTQLLGQGADVIVGSLNLGAVGTFKAVETKPVGEAWVTAKYTDKSQFGKDHYAGSVIYDFVKPLGDVLAKMAAGEKTGYYALGFDTGVTIQMPDNVPADAKTAVNDAMAKVKDGSIKVERNVTKIGG